MASTKVLQYVESKSARLKAVDFFGLWADHLGLWEGDLNDGMDAFIVARRLSGERNGGLFTTLFEAWCALLDGFCSMEVGPLVWARAKQNTDAEWWLMFAAAYTAEVGTGYSRETAIEFINRAAPAILAA